MTIGTSSAQSKPVEGSFNRKYAKLLLADGGWRALLYPLESLLVNPVALVMGLWRSRVLLGRRRSSYIGFTPAESFVKLFYYVQSESLSIHGFRGVSSTMGGARLPMRVFWYQSVPSLWIYRHLGGAFTVLIGMVTFVLTHLIWLEATGISVTFLFITTILVSISTNFLGNLFCKQNYNVLAWAFFPIVVWAIATESFWAAGLAGVVIPVFSITAFVAFALLLVYESFVHGDLQWLFFLFPGAIYFSSCMIYAHAGAMAELSATVQRLLGFIGALPEHSKWSRPPRKLSAAIFTGMLSLFPITVWLRGASLPAFDTLETVGFASVPVVWFFVNQARILRVADPQSVLIVFLSVSAAITAYSQDVWLLLCFWLVNSNILLAILYFAQSEIKPEPHSTIAQFKPFLIDPPVDAAAAFLSQIPSGHKVLLACRDPGRNYNDLFIEHFPLSELLIYAAHRTGLAVFPDFYSIAYFPEQHLWGTDIASVTANLEVSGIEYVVVPSLVVVCNADQTAWKVAGFDLLDQFYFNYLGPNIASLVVSKGITAGWLLFKWQGTPRLVEE
jgi:hypothetical protein